MVDFNNPTPDTTPVTPTPTPAAAPTNTPATGPAPSYDHMVVKKPMRKSTLWLLILLIIVAVGAGYYYYTTMTPSSPAPVDNTMMTPGSTDMTSGSDAMTATGDTSLTGDMVDSTGEDTAMNGADTDNVDGQKKNDLTNIADVLSIYFQDKGLYPATLDLLQAYTEDVFTIPMDPEGVMWNGFNGDIVSGYVYSPLYRGGKAAMGALLMARTSTVEGSNWIDADPALTKISNISKADAASIEKMICTTITMDETTVDSLKNCTAKMGSENLRYVIIK